MGESTGIDITAWVYRRIFGPGGLEDFENHEIVDWGDKPDRIVAAHWILRCLANPRCEGSAEVLDAIVARWKKVEREFAAERAGGLPEVPR
jgi:hypothetical protein